MQLLYKDDQSAITITTVITNNQTIKQVSFYQRWSQQATTIKQSILILYSIIIESEGMIADMFKKLREMARMKEQTYQQYNLK